MADILPIRPWRYNRKLSTSIDALTSPLFDVVSEKQRDVLYQKPYNSIHLSAPPPPDGADRAARILQEWKRDGVLVQDEIPGIYVYYQYFSLPGSSKEYCRKGFICHLYTHHWDEKIILRHESTIPDDVRVRAELLEKTELHANLTHGLYTDEDLELEVFMDAAISDPLYETEDYQGVRNVLAFIHDAQVIKKFMAVLKDKQVILADGHNFYEASLHYQEKQSTIHPGHIRKAGYNYQLMYLSNTEASDFRIHPFHRLIKGLPAFNDSQIIKKLEEDFIVKPVENMETLPDIIAGKQWTFGILFNDNAFKIHLKSESLAALDEPFPEEVKKLDLTVLHYFIIEKVLAISGKQRATSEHLAFSRSFSDSMKQVIQGDAQMAIITNDVTIDDVKRICQSGYTMPQKSTYFYPSVITGLLFTSINEIEFALPFYAPF